MRRDSKVAAQWWDFTTLESDLLNEAASVSADAFPNLSRDGFQIRIYDTLEQFYLAEAMEYVTSWMGSSSDAPAGLCGPIGPTEQLPLVAQIVNSLQIDVRDGHFWAMDEWVEGGKEVGSEHPLSFKRANLESWYERIEPELRMPESHLHFPTVAGLESYSKSFTQAQCLVMQGGQGEAKHWAFNDPFRRAGEYAQQPPSAADYRSLGARLVELHPLTVMQNARTSGGGVPTRVPTEALTVGPRETWQAERVSIWHAGTHDNSFGMRLTALMISRRIVDSSVPMSLLADHHNVVFNYYRHGIGSCEAELH